jgi:hypothetical protein
MDALEDMMKETEKYGAITFEMLEKAYKETKIGNPPPLENVFGWEGHKAKYLSQPLESPVPEGPPLSMAELYAKVEGKADKVKTPNRIKDLADGLIKKAWVEAKLELMNSAIKAKIAEVE